MGIGLENCLENCLGIGLGIGLVNCLKIALGVDQGIGPGIDQATGPPPHHQDSRRCELGQRRRKD